MLHKLHDSFFTAESLALLTTSVKNLLRFEHFKCRFSQKYRSMIEGYSEHGQVAWPGVTEQPFCWQSGENRTLHFHLWHVITTCLLHIRVQCEFCCLSTPPASVQDAEDKLNDAMERMYCLPMCHSTEDSKFLRIKKLNTCQPLVILYSALFPPKN